MSAVSSDSPKRWCVIAEPTRVREESRFVALDEALKKSGLQTEFHFLISTQDELPAKLEQVKSEYSQIRFAGEVGSWTLPLLIRLPSALMSLKSADALVCEGGDWWPRLFMVEGLNKMFANDAGTLDLGSSVFILGATMEARAAVAALSRIGFSKMLVSDPDDTKTSAFVEDLKRSYFGIQFQAVSRNMITQLPGICSVAVNTLSQLDDQGTLGDLAYFNFLRSGGYWLDLTLSPPNANLKTEAISVGAAILSAPHALAICDQLWAQAAFQIQLDVEGLAAEYARL